MVRASESSSLLLSLLLLLLLLAGGVAQWLECRNSNRKTLGSILWWGIGFFLSLRVNSWADFFVCTACAQMRAHVKDPAGGTGV